MLFAFVSNTAAKLVVGDAILREEFNGDMVQGVMVEGPDGEERHMSQTEVVL